MRSKNPYMKPKRSGKRYTITREDCKLDPQKDHLPKDGVKVRPVPCKHNGKWSYRLEIEGSRDNICGLDALAEDLKSTGMPYSPSTIEHIMRTLLDVVPRYIARTGRSVKIGELLTLKLRASGTIENANDKVDPAKCRLEIRATESPALRDSLQKLRIVNVMARSDGVEFVIREADGALRGEVDSKSRINVHGRGIYVTPQPATETGRRDRVWIETMDGRMLGRCAVLNSGPDMVTIMFHPDETVTVAEGRLVLETFGSQEAAEAIGNMPVSRYSCDVRFV